MKKYEDFIEKAERNIKLYISCKQWSGLSLHQIKSWINNFPEDTKIRYFAYKLLEQIIYYSEKDLKKMLKEGVFNKVILKDILDNQYKMGFLYQQHQLEFQLRDELEKTFFVPLLNEEAPFESGNQISRILTQNLRIKPQNVLFASRISSQFQDYKRLIIVDDCIGSGEQCRGFWENQIVSEGKSLRDWCKDNEVTAYYVALVGYEPNVEKLQLELEDLNICCVELLSDEHRVFCENSIYWDSKEEYKEALETFQEILGESNISLYGYDDLDFAVILHTNIPDWSLPMLWRKMESWDLLIERKNSHG